MINRNISVWLNGKIISQEAASIPILSQTLHYGFGVYEGLRSYQTDQGPAIFRLNDHTKRLFESAKILNINLPFTVDELNHAQLKVLQKSNLDNAYLRPCVFFSDDHFGLNTLKSKPQVMIAVIPWDNSYLDKEKYINGMDVHVSSFITTPPRMGLNKAKANGKYIQSIMANNQAQLEGYDDAILLDHNDFVAEGTGANLFLIKNNLLITPEVTSALDGITRNTVFHIAKKLNLTLTVTNLTREDLYTADELFFCGTAAEILPIRSVDKRIIGYGQCGEITQKIQQSYQDITQGNLLAYLDWLSFTNKMNIAEHEME
ncbi:branched-chain amino acid transaminase [Thiotrichales bacterium 19X7-9]|nr:branched-chain amino acid transaminase [Thiotrichales bacterium 19X7-9]